MREAKEKGATRFPSQVAPGVGFKPDTVAGLATNDNLSLKDEVVKETKDFIFNMDMKDLAELGLTPEQWEIILSPEKLESTIRKIVRKKLQEDGASA